VTSIPAQLADALLQRYVLERQLGHGGMATVYLAHDLKHDRPVALKVLHPHLAATLGPERFLQEIRLAARLQHPHILTVFDSGESGGHLWFTMPYVEGESLRDRLLRDGPLRLHDALRIAREAGEALQYAHDHGVVHRDVKPENILLTKDGNTLVADFGIARRLESAATSQLTETGMVVGTPSYMSPEQASAEHEIDGRSDVYSLGCVVYEMLAGSPPFTGPTVQAIIAKHLSQSAPPVVTPAGVPPAISRAIARALAKSPAERFPTAADFVSALGEAGEGVERRSPLRIAAMALGALVILGGAVVAGRRLGQGPGGSAGSVTPGRERRLSQLTVADGVEEWPAWSLDGTRLVYAGEVNGFRQLFVRTLATGEERRLTHSRRDDIQPAWSPDGRSLAFARANTPGGKLEPSDINGWYFEGGDIWSLDLASGKEIKLVDDAFGPAWSPDGARLAFDARWGGPRRIWVADARGRNSRQITADSNDAVAHAGARWSPDGARLVFRRMEKTKWDIAVANLSSSSVVWLTDDIVTDMDPAWASDGRSVYFASARGGGLNLWRMPVAASGTATGPAEQLTTGAGDDVQPAPSPEGNRIAFTVLGINSDIWRLPVSPQTGRITGSPQLVAGTTRVESRGAWSPNGRAIAFNSDRRGDMNLWVRSLADGSERLLTHGPGGDYQPNWSPDARTIVFFSSRSGNADIWAVRLSDGALTRLTHDRSTDINPFYSPDGRHIAYLSEREGRSEVWVMNADGSDQRRVYDGAAGGHFLRWTRDGTAVVFRAEIGAQTQVIAAPLAGGEAKRLPAIASGAHMSFSPDGSLILDVRGHKSLWVHPLDGGRPYQIFEFPDRDVRIDYPIWSPDGRWILFDRAATRSGDIWMLEGVR
jgi:eukaryotic-like serine/threonine-protein kinase